MKFYLRKILTIFLPINLNMCFECSKEPSLRDGCFEYPKHMYWMRNKENNFPISNLIWRPASIPQETYSFVIFQWEGRGMGGGGSFGSGHEYADIQWGYREKL